MFRLIKLFWIVLLLLSPIVKTSAQEVFTVGKSYRSLAMGNTGVASANDSSALFYNPAVLANVKGWWLDYSAWTVEFSEGVSLAEVALSLVSTEFPYINRNGLTELHKSTFLSKTNPYLRGSAGATLTANIMQEGWTVAGIYMIETIITTTDNGAQIYQRDDLIQKYGISIPLGFGQFVLGIARADITRRVANDASTDTITNWGSRYTASGHDIGILFRMANKAKLTWGLVAYNFGGTQYGDSGMEDVQTYAFGVSTSHELGMFKLVIAADIREIGTTAERQNTIHAGVEVGMFPNSTGGSYLSFRAGSNQGYITQGMELNLFNHSTVVGYAQYSEEIGIGTEKLESKRTVYYLSFGF